jgi:hypothetical protein
MVSFAALVIVPTLLQSPALPQIADGALTLPCFAVDRVDTLRCMLLKCDREEQPPRPSCPAPPVILGQWRN